MPPFDCGQMADTFNFSIQSQNMPPFDHSQMEETFEHQNMPPFDYGQMEATFKLLHDVSHATI